MSHTAKSVFITGVSSGIGHALAHRFLDEGASLYGLSRREPQDLLERDNFLFKGVNLGDSESIGPAISELLQDVTQLDLVVLNAGMLGPIEDLNDTNLNQLRELMNVNLWANKMVVDTLRSLPLSLHQVVAISSGAAVNAHRGWGGYCISKAALNMMVKLYAAEWSEVHFTALAPGLVDTHMQDILCDEVADPKFTSLERLRAARGTDTMPTPEAAAPVLMQAITLCRDFPSGEYHDVRDMDITV